VRNELRIHRYIVLCHWSTFDDGRKALVKLFYGIE
jgi:hypothetical protein